ncbi:MAG: peptide-methionine (S)-S-oxide reductase MsrA [Proteobacteria bacterium]|nr:peptide-methionine (S)-S-oxide reductase MsrA [Pseudomonadota bacterium]
MKNFVIKLFLSLMTVSLPFQKGAAAMEEVTLETATLGGGCFWCIEAIVQRLKGVSKVESGYSGGKTTNPTYQQVSSGETGHAEVIQISFDPKIISYAEILEVFLHLHDPTTLNRQGNDIGTQYRSAIFYHSEEQKQAAEEVIKKITATKLWNKPIVTEVTPFKEFYRAEEYHQNYYNRNKSQGYCSFIIAPKINKLLKEFKDKLKSDS